LVGGRNNGGTHSTGSLDHVAFDAQDLAGMRRHLDAKNVPFKERGVPGRDLHQLFIRDPDGVMIELTFRVAVLGDDLGRTHAPS
jgi:hypothetical protein